MRKVLKIFLYFIGGLLIIVLGLTITLRIKSPGKAYPITDKDGKTIPGSISTIEKVRLGDSDQYIIVRGEDSTKAVMLFLHGGPGSPEFPLMKEFNPKLILRIRLIFPELTAIPYTGCRFISTSPKPDKV